MGRAAAETNTDALRLFERAAQVLGYDLADVCWNGPADRLNSTVVSQPAIFVSSVAALEILKVTEPEAVTACEAGAGLSLGEYTALVFADAMSFEDGLRVVQRRGEAMQAAADATPSGMLSVLGLDLPKVQELTAAARGQQVLEVANLLCPGNTVVSGHVAACDRLAAAVDGAGGRVIRLTVAGAFHTSLMRPADKAVAEALGGVELRKPRLPVWSNVDARPHDDPAEICDLLVRQVLEPVQWEETMRGMLAAGFDRFYEIGPGRVLAGLLKRVQRKIDCRNVAA
jgi:[acyl-carrier-protein] S-malonyltransferase